jgi:hypothetical protein
MNSNYLFQNRINGINTSRVRNNDENLSKSLSTKNMPNEECLSHREFGKDITNTVIDGNNTMYRKSQEMKENRENYYKQPIDDKSVIIF